MFQQLLEPTSPRCQIELDGSPIEAPEGTNLAVFFMTRGDWPFRRSPVGGAPRAPYCLMGACFECLVEVDGVRDRQACQTVIRAGMRVRRQLDLESRDG